MSYPPIRSNVPGIRWPALPGAESARRLAMQFQFAQAERWPAEVIEAQQFRQIESLVAHCEREAPFWRDRLRQAGIRPGQRLTPALWSRLPVLTRIEAQAAGEKLYARAYPPEHGDYFTASTSGSTGTPITGRKTQLHGIYWFAFNLRIMLWHKLDLTADLALIRLKRSDLAPSKEGTWYKEWGEDFAPFITGRALQFDLRLSPAEQVEWLIRERIPYALTFPSNAAALARYCRDNKISLPHLRQFLTYGETMPEELRDLVKDVFGAGIIDAYSAEETGFMSAQCPGHEHHHVFAEGMKLEILNERDQPCAIGETGRVVVTPLHNFAMPMMRYEVGDLAQPGAPCTCGRTLPVISRVLGRQRDRVQLPGGGSQLAFWGANHLYKIPAIIQHQLVQVALDAMEYRLVTHRKLEPEEEAQLVKMLRDNLGDGFTVNFVYVDAIPRSPSGKYADFRSEIGQQPTAVPA